jgi:hypothetical protein
MAKQAGIGRRLRAPGLVAIASVLLLLGVSVPPADAVTLRTVSGTVTDSNGSPLAGVHVGIVATETRFAITGANGTYSLTSVPQSSAPYDVQLLFPCSRDQRKSVLVNGNKTVDFTVPVAAQTDGYGYTCKPTTAAFIDLTSGSDVVQGDDNSVDTQLPFTFRYYGVDYSIINIGVNGLASFTSPVTQFSNTPIPDATLPNSALYPFWDDLFIDSAVGASVRVQVQGTAPNRDFVIEWRNAQFLTAPGTFFTFEIVLSENKRIRFLYTDNHTNASGSTRTRGASATVGIEDGSGSASNGFQRSFNQTLIDDNSGIEFTAPK